MKTADYKPANKNFYRFATPFYRKDKDTLAFAPGRWVWQFLGNGSSKETATRIVMTLAIVNRN
jgi:hypothetical protein